VSKKVDPYDRSLKILARLYPGIFLSLLSLGETIEAAVDNPEINLPEKRADDVMRVTAASGEEGRVIFEFQFTGSKDALKRCFVKCALVHEITDLPVIGVIVYLTKKGYSEVYDMCFEGCQNQYRFETIRLWEYREEIESGKRKELAPFLILFTDEPGRDVLDKEKALIMQVEDEKERANLLSLAMTIAFHRLKEAWVREYFKEEIAMIKTADIIQEWMEESMEKGRKEGMEQGLQRGIQEGIQQGMQQGMREGLLSAISLGLELRFGIKGLKLYERIGQTSSVEKLTAIKDAIRAAKDLEEIESLL